MVHSEARERVLQAAEKLFVERGYEAVTVKDIAKAAGIKHASLYHHIDNGKSGLYIEVMTRHFERHRVGLQDAIDAHEGDLHAQLRAIARWSLTNPPINLMRLAHSDMPALDKQDANQLSNLAHYATLMPIHAALEAAQARGEIDYPHLGNIAGAIFSSLEGVQVIPLEYVISSREHMADEIIAAFLNGIRS